MGIQKYRYYLISVYELLGQVRPLSTLLSVFLRQAPEGIKQISLPKQDLHFSVRGAMDIWSVKETFLDRFYERFGVVIGSGWTIIDIGGGIGDFTTFAAKAARENRVFAFEPTPESFALLEANLARNKINNARGYPQAIWSGEGTLWIDTSVGEPGQFISHESTKTEAQGASVAVPSLSLVQAFEQLEIDRCDLLKMDCEGAEYPILYQAPNEIFVKIERIVMEYHDNAQGNHTQLGTYLQQQGYKVQITPNFVHSDLGYLYACRA